MSGTNLLLKEGKRGRESSVWHYAFTYNSFGNLRYAPTICARALLLLPLE